MEGLHFQLNMTGLALAGMPGAAPLVGVLLIGVATASAMFCWRKEMRADREVRGAQ